MRSLIPLSLLLSVLEAPVNAVIFPFEVRTNTPPATALARRDPIPVSNTGNAQYVSNITIGGQTVRVLMDTGSSDLWAHFPNAGPSNAQDTGKTVSLSYAVGKATGSVLTAQVQLANFTIDNQAFLNVQDTSTFTSNIQLQGYDGLLGLGPNTGSVIRKTAGATVAETLLQRIFLATKQTANYISFTLDRKGDPTMAYTGMFSISEIIPPFNNITSMPKLDVDKVNKLLKADQHWQALTDTNIGIIGPDGNPISVDSIVPGVPDGEFVAVIDSGFTFSQVPRAVSDQIYGRVQGAYYDTNNEWWLVPCGQYLNISFNFGGINYPIHPLDVVDNDFDQVDSTGKPVCIGAFQPITSAFSMLGHYDMILGMSYLRNTYTLLDFGDWVPNTSDQGHPSIQMLPTTTTIQAKQDFVNVRLSGNDTTSSPQWALLPISQMQHSPMTADEQKKLYQEMVLSRWPYIFVGCLAFVILTTGCCIWKCCQRRRARAAKGLKENPMLGFFSKKGEKASPRALIDQPFGKDTRESYVALADQNRSPTDVRNPFATPAPSQYDLNEPQLPSPVAQHHGYGQHYDQTYHHGQGGYPPQQEYRY